MTSQFVRLGIGRIVYEHLGGRPHRGLEMSGRQRRSRDRQRGCDGWDYELALIPL